MFMRDVTRNNKQGQTLNLLVDYSKQNRLLNVKLIVLFILVDNF